MDELGIMVYGYSRDRAEKIRDSLCDLTGRRVVLFSATGREDEVIEKIIGGQAGGEYADGPDPVLMFLGFSDIEISDAIDSFPSGGPLPRPIFCGLTEDNCSWTFGELLEHLIEEHRKFTGK